jgi:phage terminase large subunit-like protein
MVATHNTPIAAGICLYGLFCDGESGAQIYSAAADKDQAAILYRHASGMILNEPELSSRAKIYRALKSIERTDDAASVYRVLSSDAHTKHGGNSHLILVDELHAQPNRDLVDVLMTSMASQGRKQPLIVFITTADFMRPSICNEKYDYACKVRDGIIPDQSFLPVIYEAGIKDDWTSEETWKKANPNLGVSVSIDYLRRECARAKETPAFENTFKRLHLNIRTQNDCRWISMEKWNGSDSATEDLTGRECFAGLDLASVSDLAALVMLFPAEDGYFDCLARFWCPAEGAAHRTRRDRVPYEQWIKDGWIKATEGNVTDYDVIREDIRQLSEQFSIREIAVDRWNATQITTQLGGDGFEMVPFGQGFGSMSAPSKELEKIIIGKRLRHGNNPVLNWMASNVTIEQDAAGNIKPSKKKSTEKIDGIVALVMALGRAISTAPEVTSERICSVL